jgi:DNA-directed RNA polymerase subunit M/transcription elongation factor TFIIS
MHYSILEIIITCPTCKGDLFVNGPYRIIQCQTCQAVVNLPNSLWKTILTDVKWVLSVSKKDEGKRSKYVSQKGLKINWLSGNMKPYCMKCKEDLPDIVDEENSDRVLACPSCGEPMSISQPPKWIKEIDGDVVFFLNTSARTSQKMQKEKKVDPVKFTCLNCGEQLTVDGSQRIVKCNSCKSNCYLPNEIWSHFHKPKKINRWMVCFR